MSLEAFQRAFADLTASPARCVEARADPAALNGFDLDDRERRRLLAMVRHPGMSHHCTLYRANRLTPVARSLPRTCVALGARLTSEMEAFWAAAPDSELQYRREAERFGAFLRSRLRPDAPADAAILAELTAELAVLNGRFDARVHP